MKEKKAIRKEQQHYKKKWFLGLRWEAPGMGHFIGVRNRNVDGAECLEAKGICDAAAAEVYSAIGIRERNGPGKSLNLPVSKM